MIMVPKLIVKQIPVIGQAMRLGITINKVTKATNLFDMIKEATFSIIDNCLLVPAQMPLKCIALFFQLAIIVSGLFNPVSLPLVLLSVRQILEKL